MLVKFNAKRLLGFKDKIIIAGMNDLDPEFVADMMEDPVLAAKFESGELEVIGSEDIGAKPKKGKTGGVDLLISASEKSAAALAPQTVDMKILEEWLRREKRVSVRKAIKAQISKIKNIVYRDKDDKPGLESGDQGEEE